MIKTIALILGGSVAKGTERSDSDLDGLVVVSDEIYEEKKKANATAETINGFCTYEGGYFDIKYLTKGFLEDAAEKGSEPARNVFDKCKVLAARLMVICCFILLMRLSIVCIVLCFRKRKFCFRVIGGWRRW